MRQFRHERRQPVLLFLDGGIGLGDTCLHIVEQGIALRRQIVGCFRQLLDFGRPLLLDAEVAVGRQHHVQLLCHAEQTLHILLEQLVQHDHTHHETEQGHGNAHRQMRQQEIE